MELGLEVTRRGGRVEFFLPIVRPRAPACRAMVIAGAGCASAGRAFACINAVT